MRYIYISLSSSHLSPPSLRQIHNRYEGKDISNHKRNLVIAGGVTLSVIVSPVVAAVTVGQSILLLLFYLCSSSALALLSFSSLHVRICSNLATKKGSPRLWQSVCSRVSVSSRCLFHPLRHRSSHHAGVRLRRGAHLAVSQRRLRRLSRERQRRPHRLRRRERRDRRRGGGRHRWAPESAANASEVFTPKSANGRISTKSVWNPRLFTDVKCSFTLPLQDESPLCSTAGKQNGTKSCC